MLGVAQENLAVVEGSTLTRNKLTAVLVSRLPHS